jgi:hypothetical protein
LPKSEGQIFLLSKAPKARHSIAWGEAPGKGNKKIIQALKGRHKELEAPPKDFLHGA